MGDVISAIFFSHIHRDSLNLVLRNSSNAIYAPHSGRESLAHSGIYNQQSFLIVPAVSPNTHQNPTYRQVMIDEFNSLMDYTQYFYSLEDTQSTAFASPEWKMEYS